MSFDKKFDRDFHVIETILKIMIPLVFIGALTLIFLQIYFGIMAVKAVDEQGLKAVVERIWEGPNGTVK